MSHRSIFKALSDVPPSKSAREARVEKFDLVKTVSHQATAASKNVDPTPLAIALIPRPNCAPTDEIFLSNLERLPAPAPVPSDDLADRNAIPADAPIRPIDASLESQFVRANRDFIPLGNALTLLPISIVEEQISASSSTPTRMVDALTIDQPLTSQERSSIPNASTAYPSSIPSKVTAISHPLYVSAARLISTSHLSDPNADPLLKVNLAVPIATHTILLNTKSSLSKTPISHRGKSSTSTLVSPKRSKVIKHADGWSEILMPEKPATKHNEDIRKFMSSLPLENRFHALSNLSSMPKLSSQRTVKLSHGRDKTPKLSTEAKVALASKLSAAKIKKLSRTRDHRTPKFSDSELAEIASSRAIVSDSTASSDGSVSNESFVTDDSDPSYEKSSSSTSSGTRTRRERKKKNREAACTLARTQRTLERHQAKQFGARLKELASARGARNLFESIDSILVPQTQKMESRRMKTHTLCRDIIHAFQHYQIKVGDDIVMHSLQADHFNGIKGSVTHLQSGNYFTILTTTGDKFSIHSRNLNVRSEIIDEEIIVHLFSLLSGLKLDEAFELLQPLVSGNRNPHFQINLAALAQQHALPLATRVFQLIEKESELWDSASPYEKNIPITNPPSHAIEQKHDSEMPPRASDSDSSDENTFPVERHTNAPFASTARHVEPDSICPRTHRIIRTHRCTQYTAVNLHHNPLKPDARSHTPLFFRHCRSTIDRKDRLSKLQQDGFPHAWLSSSELSSISIRKAIVTKHATTKNLSLEPSSTRKILNQLFPCSINQHMNELVFARKSEENDYLSRLLIAWSDTSASKILTADVADDISALLWIFSFTPDVEIDHFIFLFHHFFFFRQPRFYHLVSRCLEDAFPQLRPELMHRLSATLPTFSEQYSLRSFGTIHRPGQATPLRYRQVQDLQDLAPGMSWNYGCLDTLAIADEDVRLGIATSRLPKKIRSDFFPSSASHPAVFHNYMISNLTDFDLVLNDKLLYEMLRFWSNPGILVDTVTSADIASFVLLLHRLPDDLRHHVWEQIHVEFQDFADFINMLELCESDYEHHLSHLSTNINFSQHDMPRAPTNPLTSQISSASQARHDEPRNHNTIKAYSFQSVNPLLGSAEMPELISDGDPSDRNDCAPDPDRRVNRKSHTVLNPPRTPISLQTMPLRTAHMLPQTSSAPLWPACANDSDSDIDFVEKGVELLQKIGKKIALRTAPILPRKLSTSLKPARVSGNDTDDDDTPIVPRRSSSTSASSVKRSPPVSEVAFDTAFIECADGGWCKNHCSRLQNAVTLGSRAVHLSNEDYSTNLQSLQPNRPHQSPSANGLPPREPSCLVTRVPTLSPPSVSQTPQQQHVLVMPQERAPRLLTSISDIPNLVKTFLPQYRIYSRAYSRQQLQFQTIFECFSEQQQRTLQLSSLLSYDRLILLSNDELLDHLRSLWGLKTPASTINTLRLIRFQGDALDRDSWILLQADFSLILDQVASRGVPSDKELAKAFIALCPFGFMRQELTNANVHTWEDALHKALDLLNDVDFVRAASKVANTRPGLNGGNSGNPGNPNTPNNSGNVGNSLVVPRQQHHNDQRQHPQHDAHRSQTPRFEGQQPPFREHRQPPPNSSKITTPFLANLRGEHTPDRSTSFSKTPSAPYPSRPPNQQHICSRCGMTGHDSKSCVRSNHVDGRTLPKLDEAEYTRRRALIPQKGNRIAGIRDDDADDSHDRVFPGEDIHHRAHECNYQEPSDLLLLDPPLGCGFILHSATEPTKSDLHRRITFVVDTRCESNSVIKSSLVKKFKLPTSRCAPIISTTATCEQITCTLMTKLTLGVYIHHQWNYFEISAMVWPECCDDLIICNSFALTSNLIRFVLPQDERLLVIGRPALTMPSHQVSWQSLLRYDEDDVQRSFNIEAMSERDENIIDLAAPLMFNAGIRFSDLSKENQEWARLFPNFLLPFPEFSHPDIPEFDAHILMDKVAAYSSPQQQKNFYKPIRSSDKACAKFADTIAELREKFFVATSNANPHGVASIAHLIPKPNGKSRFVVNCSGINKCLQLQMYPLPTIQEAHSFVGKFKCFATLDLESGYFNMSIKTESRWITRTIGPGFAIEWIRCTQGLAPMVSFFQWAMDSILTEFKEFAFVYLDDVLIGGNTKEDVSIRLHAVLKRLHDLNFRISFKKSQLSPSFTVHFLGRTFVNGFIVPGPNTSILLSKIVHPGAHSSDKHARTALRSFLGAGNYLRPHMPDWTVAVAPLYTKGNQAWTWDCHDQAAWDAGMNCLKQLKPLELPSTNPEARFEIFTDASDLAWAAILFQRQHAGSTGVEDLRLIQWDGGSFSAKQCEWTIHQREMIAVYKAFNSFHHWIRLHPIILYIDNMVLTYMDSSLNPMIQRWYAYIQDYNFSVFHVRSEENPLADAFSRLQGKFADQACIKQSASSVAVTFCAPIRSIASPLSPLVSEITSQSIVSDSSPPTPPRLLSVAALTRSGLVTKPLPRPQRPPRAASPPVEPSVTFALNVHDVPGDGACCVSALLGALRHLYINDETFSFPPPDDEQILRDALLDYIVEHAKTPCAALSGLSFHSAILAEYVHGHRELRDSAFYSDAIANDADPHQHISSFLQYISAMRRPNAYGDEFLIAAAALKFKIDIIVARENNSPAQCFQTFNPSHRIFLTQAQDHYKWAHLSSSPCSTCTDHGNSSRPRPISSLTCSLFLSVVPALRTSPPRNSPPLANPLSSIDDSQILTDQRATWIAEAHCANTGHPGRDATIAALRRSGHSWRGMFSSVSKFVDRCSTCQISRRQHIPLVSFTRQISCSARICRRWHLDLSGSFPACVTRGHQYLILFVDEISGFCFLRSSTTTCALEVAMALLELSSFFGVPDSIHSDGGSEFDSDVVHQFCSLSSTHHNLSIARHPASNGIAERNMREAKRVLRLLSIDLGRFNSWAPLLPITQRALNSRFRSSIGCSPQEFVFGNLLADDASILPCEPSAVDASALADVASFHLSANYMHRALRFQEGTLHRLGLLSEAEEQLALETNSSVSQPLALGDLVLIPWRDTTPPSSLHPKLCGPYIVESVTAHRNTIGLVHSCNPPPNGQLYRTTWSLNANVYRYVADNLDASIAAVSAIGQPLPRAVDCILSCQLLPTPLPLSNIPSDVINHRFLVRWLNSPATNASFCSYSEICNTIACDNFCASHPSLTGHKSVLLPINFDAHARPQSERPAYPPVALMELELPVASLAPVVHQRRNHRR